MTDNTERENPASTDHDQKAKARLQILSRHLRNNEDGIFGVGIHRTQDYRQRHNTKKLEVFQYTRDSKTSRLTRRDREFYEENGYVLVKNLIPREFLQRLQQRFQEVCKGKFELPGASVVTVDLDGNENGTSRSIQDFFADEVLFGYCRFPQLVDYVESFCGPNIMAMKTMMSCVGPIAGNLLSRDHQLHQELSEFPFQPNNRMVCAWTAVEPVTRGQGCLAVVPGTHKGELLQDGSYYPFWDEGNASQLSVNNVARQKVYLEMDAGDTLFFHPLLMNGVGPNRSDVFRKAISCHYAASECKYNGTVSAFTEKDDIARDLMELATKRGVALNTPKDLWTFRGQLVRGKRINL